MDASLGVDGITFGFWSNQAWFPQLNASIALVTNQDCDMTINYGITCRIVQILAKAKGLMGAAMQCGAPVT